MYASQSTDGAVGGLFRAGVLASSHEKDAEPRQNSARRRLSIRGGWRSGDAEALATHLNREEGAAKTARDLGVRQFA